MKLNCSIAVLDTLAGMAAAKSAPRYSVTIAASVIGGLPSIKPPVTRSAGTRASSCAWPPAMSNRPPIT
ncbi:hypothetical protein BIM11_6210 [Burkholderia pseudomallei]|nr:hypothetical protein BIM11_6210 [Burkholderia pseudomallei]CAK0518093.1 Uncharacterised protein [Burkholderia pseudomallei]